MEKIYTVDICGRGEHLPVLPLPSGVNIAFFNLHGNVELTEHCAKHLAERVKKYDPDVLITAESKGLQITHCVARDMGQKMYAVARKSKKLYMQDGIEVQAKTITTGEVQHLYLSAHDVDLIKGKRVAIIDDVISTGAANAALEQLVAMAGGEVVCRAFVLAEGDAKDRQGVEYLATIPLL
ncbi:MAG: adenine phosphoribosyltransferase [Clostridiales bacterium]|nr:adenine phosphoribosyltransferase [Clostridiales bacterium]